MATAKVTRLYSDDKGESHFDEVTAPLNDQGVIGFISEAIGSTNIFFRYTPGDYNFDLHNAPRRQFIINLDASVKVTVSDGESRILPPGSILFVEDTNGKGHISQAVDSKPRNSIFIAVPDNVICQDGIIITQLKRET
ncbi:unnamed protein product [Didymodactylos carnosus]|uniref:Uncharacterized protein n=1 Tax=Didymodactylos carnosus TaxID=1234261 RepID=A0A814EIU2_9BILA|nr:unnamed protein product [Didymodactylos carnosus]CAF0969975.1 unnamed protein product [Didymodactylos carnosus]CAF3610408.1 unnamed protein product [Didymodactylos carnosus]CAF3743123.1 unnamed protein product [Didymodactylos carnosus]